MNANRDYTQMRDDDDGKEEGELDFSLLLAMYLMIKTDFNSAKNCRHLLHSQSITLHSPANGE